MSACFSVSVILRTGRPSARTLSLMDRDPAQLIPSYPLVTVVSKKSQWSSAAHRSTHTARGGWPGRPLLVLISCSPRPLALISARAVAAYLAAIRAELACVQLTASWAEPRLHTSRAPPIQLAVAGENSPARSSRWPACHGLIRWSGKLCTTDELYTGELYTGRASVL